MNNKPLAGIKVCDFGQHGAGSACGKTLADWGADVIKVEPARGCGSRYAGKSLGLTIDPSENIHHEMINSGKRNISINVKTKEGAELLDKLLGECDIFFSNYRLEALKRLGLDYETLSLKFPRLICGYLTAYGPEGPKVNDPGFDVAAYWAYSGMLLDCGSEEEGPFSSPFGGGDMMTGFSLASGLAACLYKQSVTGKGEAVYTSLFGTGCWQASNMIQAASIGASQYPYSKKEILSPLTAYYRTKDNEWFIIALMDLDKQAPLLAQMIGHEELCEELKRRDLSEEQKTEYYGFFKEFYLSHTWEELDDLLTKLDIVHSRLQKVKEICKDTQAIQNHYVTEFTTRNGKRMPMVSTPVQFGDRIPLPHRSAPYIGEHTREIMTQLGYSEEKIAEYLEKNIVAETVSAM